MFCARSQRPLRPALSSRLFVPPAGPAKNSGSPLRSASISGMLDSMETPSAETRSLRIPCIFCVSVKGWKAEPSGVSQERLFILRSRLLFMGFTRLGGHVRHDFLPIFSACRVSHHSSHPKYPKRPPNLPLNQLPALSIPQEMKAQRSQKPRGPPPWPRLREPSACRRDQKRALPAPVHGSHSPEHSQTRDIHPQEWRGRGSPARAQTPVLRPEKARRRLLLRRQKAAASPCISYQSRVYWSHQKRRQQRCARCVNRSFRPS